MGSSIRPTAARAALQSVGHVSPHRRTLVAAWCSSTAIYSDLALFSDFTYFLDNPTRGDQFSQTDHRVIVGGNATHAQEVEAFGARTRSRSACKRAPTSSMAVGLFNTQDRVRFATVRQDDVRETATALFLEAESRWTPKFRSMIGVRGDVYSFDVTSSNARELRQSQRRAS